MVRIVLGVIAGFISWLIAWVGSEKILSAIWPEWFGAHQLAFQAAIEHGEQFAADSTILLIHIVLGSIISVMSGFLAALIAGENKRAVSPRLSAVGRWSTEGGYVLAVCSHLVSRYLYGDSTSNDDYGR